MSTVIKARSLSGILLDSYIASNRISPPIIKRRSKKRRVPIDHRTSIKGRYKVQVIDVASGKVVEDRPWANNLILDQGMDFLFNTCSYSQASICAKVGTGTTPVVRDSGAITVTVAAGVATASANFFEAADAASGGRLLKLDSGEEYYIDTFTDPQNVNVTGPDAAASLAAIWYVNETGLASETKRTVTYLTGAGNCDSLFVSNEVTFRRTYDFTAEGANINYSELGWTYVNAAGSNLFSRALVAGGTVTVLTGQALRVIYDLVVTVGPTVATPGTPAITGWPVAPSTTLDGDGIATEFDATVIGTVDTSGLSTSAHAYNVISKAWDTMVDGVGASPLRFANLTTVTTLPAFGTAAGVTNATGGGASPQSYVLGSFTREWRLSFGAGSANRTDWRSFITNGSNNLAQNLTSLNCYAFRFDENQTKDNLHTLRLDFTYTITRILVNP